MSTIKDVAQRAGVSVTTVSHVINGTRRVSNDARLRVDEAIRELRFVPNAIARGLRSSRSHSLGVMIPNIANPFFAEIVSAVEEAAFSAGYSVILCNSGDDPNRQARYLRLLSEKQIEGLVLMTIGGAQELDGQAFSALSMPIVALDRELPLDGVDRVAIDQCGGARLAIEHLLELGHRRIACIAGPDDQLVARERVNGWRQALHAHGIEPAAEWCVDGDFTAASGVRAAEKLLALRPRPTAIFAGNDLMAFGALSACTAGGLRVPEDISIVGFDDILLSEFTNPPLTTVGQPKTEAGRLAIAMLLERIGTNPSERRAVRDTPTRRESLQPQLHVRRSSAAAPPDA